MATNSTPFSCFNIATLVGQPNGDSLVKKTVAEIEGAGCSFKSNRKHLKQTQLFIKSVLIQFE
jgi:hypothetical protein